MQRERERERHKETLVASSQMRHEKQEESLMKLARGSGEAKTVEKGSKVPEKM